MTENTISQAIVDAAIEVHRVLGGPGLLESIYEEALAAEMQSRSIKVEQQKVVPVIYKGRTLRNALRVDLRVEGLVLVEVKAMADWHPVFEAQMLTYLRITNLRLGLVINFGERTVSAGIRRVVNGLEPQFRI